MKDAFENILVEQYNLPAFLMPAQRVIYQEGIRGNHILFPDVDARLVNDCIEEDKVIAVAEQLILAHSVQDMRDAIKNAGLCGFELSMLFRLYHRWLKQVKEKAGVELN